MKTAYIEDISNDDYHADKSYFSSSQLKLAINSPFLFHQTVLNPEEKEDKKSLLDNSMDWGSLVHCLILEPHLLNEEFAFLETKDENGKSKNWNTKDNKAFKKEFYEINKGKIILSKIAAQKAIQAVKNVTNYDIANAFVQANGTPELSGYFTCEHGLQQRIRPDKLMTGLDENLNKLLGRTTNESFIMDVKTTKSISGKDFLRDACYKFHYDLSAYMYLKGHAMITGEVTQDFYFLCVQNTYPYAVAVYKASDDFLDQGKIKYEMAVKNILMAKDFKGVVNYQNRVQEI